MQNERPELFSAGTDPCLYETDTGQAFPLDRMGWMIAARGVGDVLLVREGESKKAEKASEASADIVNSGKNPSGFQTPSTFIRTDFEPLQGTYSPPHRE